MNGPARANPGSPTSTSCGSSTGRPSPRPRTAGSSSTTTATTARPSSRRCSTRFPRKPRQPARVRSRQATAASTPIRLFTKKGVPDDWVIGRVQELSEAAPPGSQMVCGRRGKPHRHEYLRHLAHVQGRIRRLRVEAGDQGLALGSSGVAVRTPMHGHPCYEGMELQIADPRDHRGQGLARAAPRRTPIGPSLPAKRPSIPTIGTPAKSLASARGSRSS